MTTKNLPDATGQLPIGTHSTVAAYTEPVRVKAQPGEGEHHEVSCLAEELLAIDRDWERESLFSLRL